MRRNLLGLVLLAACTVAPAHAASRECDSRDASQCPAPTITALSPSAMTLEDRGAVQISGVDFGSAPVVRFADSVMVSQLVDGVLVFTPPLSSDVEGGSTFGGGVNPVSVTTPSGTSNVLYFTRQ